MQKLSDFGFNISEKELAEEYENIVFKKVMAIYCENESKKIADETEKVSEEERILLEKEINKLISLENRKETGKRVFRYAKKAFVSVAVMFFVVAFSISTVVVASADIREYFYNLLYEEKGGYTKIEVAPNDDFIDPELYDWAGAFAPTYMTNGFEFSNIYSIEGQHTVTYCKEDLYISIVQSTKGSAKINTENSKTSNITIGESRGLLVIGDGWCSVIWSVGNVMLSVNGTAEYNEIVNIANGIKIIN